MNKHFFRVVKAHPRGNGEVDMTKSCTVSQLCLVDLAGSERTSRSDLECFFIPSCTNYLLPDFGKSC